MAARKVTNRTTSRGSLVRWRAALTRRWDIYLSVKDNTGLGWAPN
jgi:hypothetical protein